MGACNYRWVTSFCVEEGQGNRKKGATTTLSITASLCVCLFASKTWVIVIFSKDHMGLPVIWDISEFHFHCLDAVLWGSSPTVVSTLTRKKKSWAPLAALAFAFTYCVHNISDFMVRLCSSIYCHPQWNFKHFCSVKLPGFRLWDEAEVKQSL